MSEKPLLIDIEDNVATLTLNRPQALNALSRELRNGLVAALKDLDARPDIRVLILTGKGRAFCAGLDVRELEASSSNVTENVEGGDLGGAIAGLRKPIIVAVNGLAVTGGFEMTLACDMAIAAESAWFADTHVKIGLLPGWGLSQRLPRLIGPNRAKELSLTARKVSAREAEALGFVNRVVADADLMPAAMELARSVAQWPAENVARVKSLIDSGYAMPFGEALDHETVVSRSENAGVALGSGKSG